MKIASIATFFAVAACSSQIGSAYERELNDERRLGMGKYSGHAARTIYHQPAQKLKNLPDRDLREP